MNFVGTFLQVFGLCSAISWGWTHDFHHVAWILGTFTLSCGWACKRNDAVSEIKQRDGVVGVLKLLLFFQAPMNALIWFAFYGSSYGLGSVFN